MPALAHELSCRYVIPLSTWRTRRGGPPGWTPCSRAGASRAPSCGTNRTGSRCGSARSSSTGWAAEIGADRLADGVTRAVFSPRALGVMYPVLRAFGSPRVGYGALAQLVPRMNKVSAVSVSARAARRRRDRLPSGARPSTRSAHRSSASCARRRSPPDRRSGSCRPRASRRPSASRAAATPAAIRSAGSSARRCAACSPASWPGACSRSCPGARRLDGAGRAGGGRRAGADLGPARARTGAADLRRRSTRWR